MEAVRGARSEFRGKPNDGYLCWDWVGRPGSLVSPAAYADQSMAVFHRLWDLVAPALDALHAPAP